MSAMEESGYGAGGSCKKTRVEFEYSARIAERTYWFKAERLARGSSGVPEVIAACRETEKKNKSATFEISRTESLGESKRIYIPETGVEASGSVDVSVKRGEGGEVRCRPCQRTRVIARRKGGSISKE